MSFPVLGLTHACECVGVSQIGVPGHFCGPAVGGAAISVSCSLTEGASLSACRRMLPVASTPGQASLESCGDRTRSLIPFLLKKKERKKKIPAGNFCASGNREVEVAGAIMALKGTTEPVTLLSSRGMASVGGGVGSQLPPHELPPKCSPPRSIWVKERRICPFRKYEKQERDMMHQGIGARGKLRSSPVSSFIHSANIHVHLPWCEAPAEGTEVYKEKTCPRWASSPGAELGMRYSHRHG